jgi:hypothetical protein
MASQHIRKSLYVNPETAPAPKTFSSRASTAPHRKREDVPAEMASDGGWSISLERLRLNSETGRCDLIDDVVLTVDGVVSFTPYEDDA